MNKLTLFVVSISLLTGTVTPVSVINQTTAEKTISLSKNGALIKRVTVQPKRAAQVAITPVPALDVAVTWYTAQPQKSTPMLAGFGRQTSFTSIFEHKPLKTFATPMNLVESQVTKRVQPAAYEHASAIGNNYTILVHGMPNAPKIMLVGPKLRAGAALKSAELRHKPKTTKKS